MTRKLHRSTLNVTSRSDEGVERTAAGTAPTAFRIWRAGENKCDDGSIFFTEESASKLMAEQASKDRPMSIDFDHLSLSNDRPAEAGRAAGWHRLEARDTDAGPELWAVDVEWSPDVASGLEEQPPRWRFFSPAFYTDDENEVTSYINLALCINPMTHGIPLLASRKLNKENTMTADELKSQLDAMIEATDDPDLKAALTAASALADDAASGETDPPADKLPTAASEKVETTAASADPPAADKKDDDAEKKAATVHTNAVKADPVASLAAKVVELERRAEVSEINELLAKHVGLPDEFKAHCRKASLPDAKVMITTVVGTRTHAVRNTKPSQASPDGSSAMDPRDGELMDRQMGVHSASGPVAPHKLPDGRFVMHNVRPSDLARMNAQKAKV